MHTKSYPAPWLVVTISWSNTSSSVTAFRKFIEGESSFFIPSYRKSRSPERMAGSKTNNHDPSVRNPKLPSCACWTHFCSHDTNAPGASQRFAGDALYKSTHWHRHWYSAVYRFFDLSLVRFDLLLQFIDHVVQSVLCLTILVGLQRQFLHASLLFASVLVLFLISTLLAFQLKLQFADTLLQFCQSPLSTFHCWSFSFVQVRLKLFHLYIKTSKSLC